MMRSTFGAPFGGTTRGGQYGVDSGAVSLIVPPNGSGGGGSWLPSIVTVAPGEPGTPVICWAKADVLSNNVARAVTEIALESQRNFIFVLKLPRLTENADGEGSASVTFLRSFRVSGKFAHLRDSINVAKAARGATTAPPEPAQPAR
jgi:hypothetical protein